MAYTSVKNEKSLLLRRERRTKEEIKTNARKEERKNKAQVAHKND